MPRQVDCDANSFVGRECIYCCAIWQSTIEGGNDDKQICEDAVSGNPSNTGPRGHANGISTGECWLFEAGACTSTSGNFITVEAHGNRWAYRGKAGLFYGLIIGGVLLVCLLGCCLVGGALYLRFWRNKPKPGGGGGTSLATAGVTTATPPPTMPAAGSMKFDPFTGKPIEPKPMFDPYTGKPLDPAAQPTQTV